MPRLSDPDSSDNRNFSWVSLRSEPPLPLKETPMETIIGILALAVFVTALAKLAR